MPVVATWFLLGLMLLLIGCGSNHVVGTSYSVILKPASQKDRYYGSFSLIKADEWQNGRGRLTPLSYGSVDQSTGALRFTLPMPDGLSGEQAICLMIVGNGGPVSVRPTSSGAEQYTFRNPLWEAELQRLTVVKRTEQEVQRLVVEAHIAKAAAVQSEQPLKTINAQSPQECREGPPVPIPPRPTDAVVETERKPTAAGVCAASWEEVLGDSAGGYYQLASRDATWEARKAESARQKRMHYDFGLKPKQWHALRIAPHEGERWVYYDATVALFHALTSECETRVVQAFADETMRWEQAIQEAQAAPAKVLSRCQELTTAYQEAARKWQTAEASLAQQKVALRRYREKIAKTTDSESLVSSTCP